MNNKSQTRYDEVVDRAGVGDLARHHALGGGLGPWLVGAHALDDLALDLRLRQDGSAIAGDVHARTERSSLAGTIALADGLLDGTRVEGTVAAADLAAWVEMSIFSSS